MFTRCEICKRGFPLGYEPIQYRRGIAHFECEKMAHLAGERASLRELLRRAARSYVNAGGTYAEFVDLVADLKNIPIGMDWDAQWRLHYALEGILGLREGQVQQEAHSPESPNDA